MSSLFAHIMEPGSSFKLIPVVRVVSLCLIGICCALFYYDVARVHMVVMIFLAGGLLASVTWLMHLLEEHGGTSAAGGGADPKANPQGSGDPSRAKSD